MKTSRACRENPEIKKPNCAWCMKRDNCRGPIIARASAYSYYNCPYEPDTGGKPRCGTLIECRYCSDAHKYTK